MGTKNDRVAVVVNGNARQVTQDLVEILDQLVQSGDLFVSRSLEEGREIAARIVDQQYPVVLTGGGDGTFVQMVTWITREAEAHDQAPPRFGLLKLGTGNALAWVLGAQNKRGQGVVADLARLRSAGGHNTLRLLEVNDQLTPFAGAGGDALGLKHFNDVKDRFRKLPVLKRFGTGALAYAVAGFGMTAPELLVRPKLRVRIVNEGEPADRLGDDGQPLGEPIHKGEVLYEGPCHATFMSTIPYWGLGARIFPFASDRDDRFNVRVVNIGPVEILSNLPAIWRGTYRHKDLLDFAAQSVSLHFPSPAPIQIGGDPAGMHDQMRARLHPKPIEVVDYYAPPPIA